uniref:Uncharacterized protein n=1 Tax=Antarctic circular DNA molecule TaxID=2664238 RepID=A0A5Q2EYS3_9ZZZZ|nr:hypothetical protein [Antarctic circular DNA molecule]
MKRKQSNPRPYARKRVKAANATSAFTVSDVSRIARRVVRNAAETKQLVIYTSVAPVDNSVTVINLCSTTQGVTEAQVIGEKIYIEKVKLRHFMFNNNNTNASKQVRLVVFMAKEEITATTQASVTAQNLFKTAVGGLVLPINPTDDHKIKVLYDVVLKLQPTLSNFTVTNLETREYNYEVKIGRNFTYKDGNCSYGEKQTLYLAVVGYEQAGATQPVGIQTFSTMYYRDM